MKEFFWKHDVLLKLIFLAAIVFFAFNLFVINVYLFFPQPESLRIPIVGGIKERDCGKACRATIEEIVSSAILTLSARLTSQQTTQIKTGQLLTFIPLGGSGSTKQRDWVDVPTAQVALDIGDYKNPVEVRWEAFLRVDQGQGIVFVRLFDVTHGIGVQGSEIQTQNSSFTQIESGQLSFWSGKNTYRVQIKSLIGYEAFFDSGRVKIVTK